MNLYKIFDARGRFLGLRQAANEREAVKSAKRMVPGRAAKAVLV